MIRLNKLWRPLLGSGVLLAGILIALPLIANEAEDSYSSPILVTGPVEFSQAGSILVAGYVIDSADGFPSSILHEGNVVKVSGSLLGDGMTIQAESVELFDVLPTTTSVPPVMPTPLPIPTVTSVFDYTPITQGFTYSAPVMPLFIPTPFNVTSPVPTLPLAPPAEASGEGCNRPDHPQAMRIAAEFEISYDAVIGMHCGGNGFGEITRALLLSELTGVSAQEYLDRQRNGEGWGQIMQEAGVHPGDLAPGRGGGPRDERDEDRGPGNGRGRGNGNGRGRGNSNGHGRGNGHDDDDN